MDWRVSTMVDRWLDCCFVTMNGERVSDGEWRERVLDREWRERFEINNKKSVENDYLNKIEGRRDKLM